MRGNTTFPPLCRRAYQPRPNTLTLWFYSRASARRLTGGHPHSHSPHSLSLRGLGTPSYLVVAASQTTDGNSGGQFTLIQLTLYFPAPWLVVPGGGWPM